MSFSKLPDLGSSSWHESMLLSQLEGPNPLRVVRDGVFSSLGFLSDPQPAMLSFIGHERYIKLALRCASLACVVTCRDIVDRLPDSLGVAIAEEPQRTFYDLHNYLLSTTDFYGRKGSTEIHPLANVHPRSYIADNGVVVGEESHVGPNCCLLTGSLIGRGVRIDAGSTIGAPGLQIVRSGTSIVELEHAGTVVIGDGAHIMSNSVIARGVFRQSTVIGEEVRVGNVCFISHNVRIGHRSIIGHGVTINGSVQIGSDVWVGPGATLVNGIRIGDGAQISLGSVVIRDVPPGQRVSGNFALEHRRFLRHLARVR